jgi:hypothetical protein
LSKTTPVSLILEADLLGCCPKREKEIKIRARKNDFFINNIYNG